ncbi:MAG: hypothetical protein ACRES8_07735 [Nevskiaceae bacterium]
MNPDDPATRACLRFGWTWLAIFLLGGLTLEALHGIKAAWYLEQHLRRELWILAHAHGALLALLNLAFAVAAAPLYADARKRALAGRTLRWGSLLVPAGFFFGGIGNSETDPSLPILATPVGALLVLHALASAAVQAWRRPAR